PDHVVTVSNVDAHFARPIQQDAIKFLAAHLKRLRPGDFSNVGEVNVSSALAVVREQARTPFVRKTCGLDLFSHTQGRKRIVRSRQQRLADMKSREGFALKKHNRMATLPERDCCRRSSRTATGDSEIKVELRRRR